MNATLNHSHAHMVHVFFLVLEHLPRRVVLLKYLVSIALLGSFKDAKVELTNCFKVMHLSCMRRESPSRKWLQNAFHTTRTCRSRLRPEQETHSKPLSYRRELIMFSESNESIPAYQNIVNLKAKAINFEKKNQVFCI